jgi:hypothetical protein
MMYREMCQMKERIMSTPSVYHVFFFMSTCFLDIASVVVQRTFFKPNK